MACQMIENTYRARRTRDVKKQTRTLDILSSRAFVIRRRMYLKRDIVQPYGRPTARASIVAVHIRSHVPWIFTRRRAVPCCSYSCKFIHEISDCRQSEARWYLETDEERRTRIHVLEVAVLLASIDVHLVVHRDCWQVLVRKAVHANDDEQEHSEM